MNKLIKENYSNEREKALIKVEELNKKLDSMEQEMKDIEALRREIINKYNLNKD